MKKQKNTKDEMDEMKKETEVSEENDVNEEAVENNEEISAEDKLKEIEAENKKLKDEFLRKAAEFENYKRRTENDQMNIIKYAAEGFIMKILPVYNDIERSLSHVDDESNYASFVEGMKLVFDKFKKTLDEQGVKKIEAKGQPFDFNYHEALMQQPAKNVEPHTVLEEIEPGYTYKDKVIKHAKVIVSQELVEPESDKDEEKSEE